MSAAAPLNTAPTSEVAALWRSLKTQGSTQAREALFNLHLPLARKIAARHFKRRWGGQIEYADLSQLAIAGLLEAIDRFDPDLGASFQSYAAHRISGSIMDGLAKTNEVQGQVSFRARMRRERAKSLSVANSDRLSHEDALTALIDLAVGLAIGFMLEGSGLYSSGDAPDPRPNAYESLAWKETLTRVSDEVDHLSERERLIIRHHYGDGLSFDQIGALFSLSKGRISQLHRHALGELRTRLTHVDAFRLER